MLILKSFNINIYHKKTPLTYIHLKKSNEIYTIIKRFIGEGHGPKILAAIAKKVPPINKPPVSSYNPIKNTLEQFAKILGKDLKVPSTTTTTPSTEIDNPNTKRFNNIFDSTKEKATQNYVDNSKISNITNWNSLNTLLLKISENNIPPLNELNDILKILETVGPLPENKITCHKQLKKVIDNLITPPENLLIELSDMLISETNTLCITRAKYPLYNLSRNICMNLTNTKTRLTKENFENQLVFLQAYYSIFTMFDFHIPEKDFIFYLKRLGLMINPDAIYLKDNTSTSLITNKTETIIIGEGEGPKLDSEIYKSITTNCNFKKSSEIYPDPNKVLNCIKNGNIFGGILIRNPDPNNIILSGYDLHPILVIEDNFNTNYYLIFAMLTSTKDNNTILLSETQEDFSKESNTNYCNLNNNPDIKFPKNHFYETNNVKKAQLIRFSSNLIHLPKKDFEELPKATNYINNPVIHNKILSEIIPFTTFFINSPYQEILDLTKENLLPLITKTIENKIIELQIEFKKYKNKLNQYDIKKKEQEIQRLENQEKNMLTNDRKNAYLANLSNEFQKKIQLLREITSKIEIAEKNKISKLKHEKLEKFKLEKNIKT